MSGIAGVYCFGGCTAETRLVHGMVQTIAHRGGPTTTWSGGAAGLGGRPWPDPRSAPAATHPPSTLVFDGRLDNRDDLARAFGWTARHAADAPDEAFLLAAYRRWGVDSPQHLAGPFAFALWDADARHLFCARDHLGVRPFYYTLAGGRFAFGSEIKALLVLPGVPRRLHVPSVADFLMCVPEDREATFYEGIHRLPPAHTLTVAGDGMCRRRYWTLDPERTLRLESDAAYAAAFRELFESSVRCRLRTDRRVGTMLSGGLDSSAITTVARAQLAEAGRGPLDTFSLVFDAAPASDERRYVAAVVEQGGLRPHDVPGDRAGVFDELDRMLFHLDAPFLGPNLFLHWALYGSAQRHGVSVLLDGLLGDSVVYHGDGYLTELAARGRLVAFGREAYHTARKWGGGVHGARYVARRYVWSPLVAEPLRGMLHALPGRTARSIPDDGLLDPAFARHVGWAERAEQLARGTPVATRAAHHEELTSGLIPATLEIVDRAAAAFGIDARFPFADHRLATFCLALPPAQRLRRGQTRFVLRHALAGYLPNAIVRRNTKGNLGPALGYGLQTLDAPVLRSVVEDRLAIAQSFVNVPAVRRLYRQLRDGSPSRRARMALWQIVVLVRWLEREQDAARRAGPARPAPDARPSEPLSHRASLP